MRLLIGGLALAAATAACGRQSALARPAPLFGAQAQADYQADQAAAGRSAARRDAARRATRGGTAPATNTRTSADPNATDSSSVDPSNAPPTTRDVQDPAQRLEPLSSTRRRVRPIRSGRRSRSPRRTDHGLRAVEAGFLRACGGALLADGVPLTDIARAVDTPIYVHSAGALETNFTLSGPPSACPRR